MTQRRQAGPVVHVFLHTVVALVLSFAGKPATALSCPVVHHGPPTEAHVAALRGDHAKAETLYRAELAANPKDTDLTGGLVEALLGEGKVQEAADIVNADLEALPQSAALLTLRGEVELRQGLPWAAANTANESAKLDPCNANTQMLLVILLSLNSMPASLQEHLAIAHQLDPDTPEIRLSWITSLPPEQRLPELEAFLAEGVPESEAQLRILHNILDDTRRQLADPTKSCHLASAARATQITGDYRGLELKLNGHSFPLLLFSTNSGIVVNRNAARLAGLKPIQQSEPATNSTNAAKPYRALVDSIRVGDLEFQNCVVQVVDNSVMPGSYIGYTGLGVFSDFLVTLEYPAHRILLAPLPTRPGEDPAAAKRLKSESSDDAETGATKGSESAAETAKSPTGNSPQRFFNRYIAPEMQDYTKVYRSGRDFILPTQLNGSSVKLFIINPASASTLISKELAAELTKVEEHPLVRTQGIDASPSRVAEAERITFQFAHVSRELVGVAAVDMSSYSKHKGMEISGIIGADILRDMTIHIDYRDALMKFEYDPKAAHH